MMPEWLQELNQVQGVCQKAQRDITSEDPSSWWAYSPRGDWMLYYMSCLIEDEDGLDQLMDDIAAYVRCPVVEYYISGSDVDVDPGLLASLANRIRSLWPDLPLVM